MNFEARVAAVEASLDVLLSASAHDADQLRKNIEQQLESLSIIVQDSLDALKFRIQPHEIAARRNALNAALGHSGRLPASLAEIERQLVTERTARQELQKNEWDDRNDVVETLKEDLSDTLAARRRQQSPSLRQRSRLVIGGADDTASFFDRDSFFTADRQSLEEFSRLQQD